nr:PKD domain-containing protein [Bacteroidota bacterium]
MKQFLLFIFLIPFAVISYGGVSNVVVSGHVFDEITGQAVPNHIVTVKFRNIDPPVVYFEKVSTGQSGFYSHVLSLPVSNGIIEVSTIDCYHQILSQSLPFNVYNNNLIADFTICYVPQLTYCHSDFIFVPDPEENNHILFKETSLGDIDSWYWDFGDGDISYEPDPTHLYIEDGIYEVCLTITGNSGSCDDQFCALVSYVGDSICQANFISFPVSGLANTIQFLDLSVGAIHTWYWDFGDGEDSNLQSPTHTYTEPGPYEVCLTVEDTVNLCSDTYCSSVQVGGNFECQSHYNYFYDPGNPMGVQFYDNAIGYPTDWYWEFGDGSSSVNQNPFHVYSNEGIYNVCLTISSDITGCIDTYCDMIMVYIE